MDVLVTVKAYPEPSRRHGEVVCVAGVRTDVTPYQWIRLWPIVDFRDLPVSSSFRKYQFVHLQAPKSRKDPRPESHAPNPDTMRSGEFLDPKGGWTARRPYVEPVIGGSMCELLERQAEDGTSLGAFRPAEVLGLEITENEPWSDSQKNALAQLSLLASDRAELEWVPYRFRYRYRCSHPDCNTHAQSIIDWELKQAWRSWSKRWPDDWADRIRHRWVGEMCADDRDTVFFVGNQFMAPRGFLVLGVWWPPRQPARQLDLLDGDGN